MKVVKCSFVLATTALLSAATTMVLADEVSGECRGVAAGVVASMRASGELVSQELVDVAVLAARRACAAAREGLEPTPSGTIESATSAPSTVAKNETEVAAEPTIWELLTRDRELKPGNERLRRLKQQ
jgi:hypothetical protein